MTLLDSEDMRERTCQVCGAVVWDRVAHQRHHRVIDALVDGMAATAEVLAEVVREDP